MLQDLLKSKTALFKDGARTILRGHENRITRVAFQQGNMVSNTSSMTRGVNARVCMNGLYGFSSTAEYSEAAAEEVLKAATANAEFLSNNTSREFPVIPAGGRGIVREPAIIAEIPQKRIVDACLEIDAHIAAKYPKLSSRVVSYSSNSMDKVIYTSDAFCGHVTNPRSFIYVVMTAESKDGAPIELYTVLGGFGSFDDWFNDVTVYYGEIDALYGRLMDKCNGVYAEAGYKTVILGGKMAGMLAHEAVGHTVEADLVMGGSVAGPNLNKRVGSELVNMVDFAHTALGKDAPLPVYMDDEGIEAKDAVLIKDGILVGYMHNRESAARFGMEPCGNARAWEFSDEPLIRMRNTAILPGKDKIEDMIASVEDGYYLLESGNGQADVTGEFMFGVTLGYEIKHGKLGRALLDTTVSGVAFDMLKTVDMVSDNMIWSTSGFCGKKQPMAVSMGGSDVRCKIMIGGR